MTEPAKTTRQRLLGDPEETHVRMSFGEHLEELRKRLFYAILGAAVVIGVCLWYAQDIIAFIATPYMKALKVGGYVATFQYSHPAGPVLLYLSVGFKAGLIVAAPWILYQIWLFVAAGLYRKERRLIYKYIGPSILLFLAGVAFFYLLVLPLTLRFFVEFTRNTAPDISKPTPSVLPQFLEGSPAGLTPQQIAALPTGDEAPALVVPVVKTDPAPAATAPATGSAPAPAPSAMRIWYNAADGRLKARVGSETLTFITGQQDSLFTPFPKMDEYLHFVLFTALVFGACFELPMVMLILAQIGIVAVATFRKIRKFAWFGIAILAAILAPSADVLSMMSLMIPLVCLYEVGIVIAAMLVKKRAEQPAVEEPQEPESLA